MKFAVAVLGDFSVYCFTIFLGRAAAVAVLNDFYVYCFTLNLAIVKFSKLYKPLF